MSKKKKRFSWRFLSGLAIEKDNRTAKTLWAAQDIGQTLKAGEMPVIEAGAHLSPRSYDRSPQTLSRLN